MNRLSFTLSGGKLCNEINDDTLLWANSIIDNMYKNLRGHECKERTALFLNEKNFEVFCETLRERIFFKFEFCSNTATYTGVDYKPKLA